MCRYLLSILLDPVFVMPWGLGMGGEGAGLAELCGLRLFCCADVRAEKAHLYFAVSQKPLYEKSIVYGVCGVGIPAVIHNLLNVTGRWCSIISLRCSASDSFLNPHVG